MVYMAYREPAVVNIHYIYVHVVDLAMRDAPKRDATLLKAMLCFWELVEMCVWVEPFSVAPILHANVVLSSFYCPAGTQEGPRRAALHGLVQVAVSVLERRNVRRCGALVSRFHASRSHYAKGYRPQILPGIPS